MARIMNTIYSKKNYKLVTFSPLFSNGPCEVEWAFTPLKSISQNGKDLHEMEISSILKICHMYQLGKVSHYLHSCSLMAKGLGYSSKP